MKNGEALTDGIATEGGTFELPVTAEMQEALQVNGSKFTVTVKAEWCQQETSVSEEYVVELKDGIVDVEGFQANTNKAEGGVSEFMPTFRAVAHSSKQFLAKEGAEAGKLVTTTEIGMIYAQTESAQEISAATMVLNSSDEYIRSHAAEDYHAWGGQEIDTNYFSLTIKEMDYHFENLEKKYSFRAYAKLSNGEIRYGEHIYTVSNYEIAQNLYENQKMPNLEAHNFLYNEILNVVAMNHNYNQIGNAMNKALKSQYGNGLDQATYQGYIQTFGKDLVYYSKCINGYKYETRKSGDFTSVKLGKDKQAALLSALNNAQEANYETVYDWIKNETGKYGKTVNGVNQPYEGFYQEVEYGWDNAYSTAFETL